MPGAAPAVSKCTGVFSSGALKREGREGRRGHPGIEGHIVDGSSRTETAVSTSVIGTI